MKAGAIFDMDGTLLDTERLYRETWEELAGEYGQVHNPAFPRAVAGTSGDHMLDVIRSYYPAVDAEQFRTSCLERVRQKVETSVGKKKGMDELLEYLKRNHVKMAVASSNSAAQIKKNMTLAGAVGYFSVLTGGDEIENGKPAPDIFLLAAQRLGIEPSDCYVFEDGINGVRAGVAAGCRTVMIPDGNEANAEMYRICAGVYDDLLQVKQALERNEI